MAMNAHVIEYRNHVMQAAIWNVYMANLGWREERDAVAQAEAAAGYKHGWFFDPMFDRVFQNDGGKGIVWCDQPVMD